MRRFFALCAVVLLGAALGSPSRAQTPGAAAPAAPAPYDKWTKDAQKQDGLFTVWRKEGKVYLELSAEQLDKDFLETAVPANGLGGFAIVSGQMFQQEARVLRFARTGDRVALIWPQTHFFAAPNTPLAEAVRLSTADSVIGVAPVVSENATNKHVVVDMSLLLGDVMNFTATLGRIADPHDPLSQYHLDPSRTYFGATKAFPNNVIIEADQTFSSLKPSPMVDTVVDPRSIQVRVTYNLIALPENDGYMPRLQDDRIGYWEADRLRFDRLYAPDNVARYIVRWNLQPSDPSKPMSPAIKPIVYTLSNSIPLEYRDPIRRAILQWNTAFERIGISNAVQVADQPSDPNWDPDDVRYNVVRWITQAHEGGFSEAQIVWDPRTGEILRGGVIIDSDLVHIGALLLRARTFPSVDESDSSQLGHNDGAPMAEQFAFGVFAQSIMTGQDPRKIAARQIPDLLYPLILHEVGHDFGLAHNFIAHNAYTEKELRQKSFTSKNGISASVMDYIPFNIAPRNAINGDLFQTVLGPYDYHAIAWGYGRIPGAATPEDEVPALDRIASQWSDPRYRFASDEDVDWNTGHAIDPRVAQFVLSDDAIGWCQGQMRIVGDLIDTLDARFPATQHPWDEERAAFGYVLGTYVRCAVDASHFIGGEYLSRARRGDPHAALPLTPVSRSDELRAFGLLDRYVFANAAWKYSPLTLRRLVYSEHSVVPFSDNRNTPPRHDISVSDVAARVQNSVLGYLFSPLVMARIADLPMKSPDGKTMTLADLFTWSQQAIYGDVGGPHGTDAGTVRRNLQRSYARLLAKITVSPAKGTPYDAQALARFELADLAGRADRALRQTHDVQLRAHLEALRADARRALSGRALAGPASAAGRQTAREGVGPGPAPVL